MMVSVSGRVNGQTMIQRKQGIKEIFLQKSQLLVPPMIWTWDFTCLHGIFMSHLTDIKMRTEIQQHQRKMYWIIMCIITIS